MPETDEQQVEDLKLEDEQEQETEESEQETEEETTEEAEAEESEETDGKAKPKVEKRINALVADKKALEEVLRAKDEDLKASQEQIDYLSNELQTAQSSYDKLFPGTAKPLEYDGKPLEALTEAQFARAVANIQHLDAQKYDIQAITNLAIAQREQGVKLTQDKQAITQEEQNILFKSWQEASAALVDPECGGHPDIAKFRDPLTQEIERRLADGKKGQFLRNRMVKGGAVFIASYALQVFQELGFDKKLQVDTYGKERPGLNTPVGQTTGKGSGTTAGGKPVFTRAKLAELLKKPEKVSDKQMAEIDKAMAEGRIR